MIISLGAIMWVLYQMSGGDDTEGIIPQEHIQSMEKASSVEQTVQDAAQQRLKDLDQSSQ
jgi:2-iminoacetate synthase ThiH